MTAPLPSGPKAGFEATVRKQAQFLDLLGTVIEKNAAQLTADDINKAFGFMSVALEAARNKALLSLSTGGLANFTLDAELPKVALPAARPTPRPAEPNPDFGRFGGEDDDDVDLSELEEDQSQVPPGYAPDGTRLVGAGPRRARQQRPATPKRPSPEQLLREDLEDGAGFLDE